MRAFSARYRVSAEMARASGDAVLEEALELACRDEAVAVEVAYIIGTFANTRHWCYTLPLSLFHLLTGTRRTATV